MVLVGTILKVIDNSGAKLAKCIRIVGVGHRPYGNVGDRVVVAVRSVNPLKKLKKGMVMKGVIVRVAKKVRRPGGDEINCMDNAVVLLKNNDTPLGTRVTGPVFLELRYKGFSRVVSQATLTI